MDVEVKNDSLDGSNAQELVLEEDVHHTTSILEKFQSLDDSYHKDPFLVMVYVKYSNQYGQEDTKIISLETSNIQDSLFSFVGFNVFPQLGKIRGRIFFRNGSMMRMQWAHMSFLKVLDMVLEGLDTIWGFLDSNSTFLIVSLKIF